MFDYLSLHDGPVVTGLEQHETVFAKNQPQYIPMRTLPGENGNSAIARFHPTNEQRNAIAEGADLYLEILHFKGPLAPSRLMVMSDPSAKQTRFKSWWRSQTKGPYEVNDDAAKAELETDSQESPAAERSEAAAPRSVVAGTKYSEILVAAQPAPTPRTDALHNQMEDSAYPDMLDLARQLERELASAHTTILSYQELLTKAERRWQEDMRLIQDETTPYSEWMKTARYGTEDAGKPFLEWLKTYTTRTADFNVGDMAACWFHRERDLSAARAEIAELKERLNEH